MEQYYSHAYVRILSALAFLFYKYTVVSLTSHIFTQHIYDFMHLQNLFVKLTNKQHTCQPSITSVFTRCIFYHC